MDVGWVWSLMGKVELFGWSVRSVGCIGLVWIGWFNGEGLVWWGEGGRGLEWWKRVG